MGQLGTYLRGGRLFVLGGDFNFVEDLVLDKAGGDVGAGSVGSVEMGVLRETFDLRDAYRFRHPAQREFSFRGGEVFTRLDRLYVSAVLLTEVRWAGIVPCFFSDHSLAGLTFESAIGQGPHRGRGFWKCSVSLLGDGLVREAVARLWSALSGRLPKDMQWWEHCKRAFKERARERRRAFSSLQSTLGFLQAHDDASPGSFSEVIRSLKDEQEALLPGCGLGCSPLLLRRPSHFFMRKEQQHGQDKVIRELLVGGCRLTEERAIAEACCSFYETLYAEEEVDCSVERSFLEGLPQLSQGDRDSLEGDLTLEEVWTALRGMKAGKSRGLDGLPKEFYVQFFHLFGRDLVSVLNEARQDGVLGPPFRTGVVTLVCKDRSRRDQLNYWRPIALLNVDYKLVSKVLCNRLSGVIGSVVREDQVCGIRERSIFDHLHLLRDVCDYVDRNGVKIGILNLDQAKAFDRVSHRYLFDVLEAFGVGPGFRSWVRLLYTDVLSRILVNGNVTAALQVRRSVRQGCGLSPLLYILSVEPFARKVRGSSRLSGLQIPSSSDRVRTIQYADDISVLVRKEAEVRVVLAVAELFHKASGALLNKEKSRGIWLGGSRASTTTASGSISRLRP